MHIFGIPSGLIFTLLCIQPVLCLLIKQKTNYCVVYDHWIQKSHWTQNVFNKLDFYLLLLLKSFYSLMMKKHPIKAFYNLTRAHFSCLLYSCTFTRFLCSPPLCCDDGRPLRSYLRNQKTQKRPARLQFYSVTLFFFNWVLVYCKTKQKYSMYHPSVRAFTVPLLITFSFATFYFS